MVSYRQQLAKIGIGGGAPVRYGGFFLPPRSLRATMRSMDAPQSYPQVIPGDEWDADWTDEIQGVAFHADRWFFSQNHSDHKRLWVLRHGDMKKLKAWNLTGVPKPALPGFSFFHFGAVLVADGLIYIDHWCDAGGQILVMQGDENAMTFKRWICLDNAGSPPSRMGMVAINTERQRIVTCGGEKGVGRLFLHDMNGTLIPDRTLKLQNPISGATYVQGGFWSPNNHVYLSAGQGGLLDQSKSWQYIHCVSPLNGRMFASVPVRSAEGRQELEGCAFAAVNFGGKACHIHAVLLENEVGTDDVYFKSFTADRPDLI